MSELHIQLLMLYSRDYEISHLTLQEAMTQLCTDIGLYLTV